MKLLTYMALISCTISDTNAQAVCTDEFKDKITEGDCSREIEFKIKRQQTDDETVETVKFTYYVKAVEKDEPLDKAKPATEEPKTEEPALETSATNPPAAEPTEAKKTTPEKVPTFFGKFNLDNCCTRSTRDLRGTSFVTTATGRSELRLCIEFAKKGQEYKWREQIAFFSKITTFSSTRKTEDVKKFLTPVRTQKKEFNPDPQLKVANAFCL